MTVKVGPWRLKREYHSLPAGIAVTHTAQDPKYVGYHGLIYNRLTGEAIPPWEPVFVLRAKDRFALEALSSYQRALEQHYEELRSSKGAAHAETRAAALQLWGVGKQRAAFTQFTLEQSAEMKVPDTHFAASSVAA